MTKNIFKEIIITLLICVVIIILLAIIFYNYNPLNKVVPNKIAYSTPEDIKAEIADDKVEDVLQDGYNVIYKVEDADLDKYTKSNRYIPGKAHPFGDSEASIGADIDTKLDVPELEGSGGVTSSPVRLQGKETETSTSSNTVTYNTTSTSSNTSTTSNSGTTTTTSRSSTGSMDEVQPTPTPVKPK